MAGSGRDDTRAATVFDQREIGPEELAGLGRRVRVVDVREASEFDGELGHIPGARLVPLQRLERAARRWDPEDEIVLVCRTGLRSAVAAATLARLGFRRVLNLRGGMLAYLAAGLPVPRRR